MTSTYVDAITEVTVTAFKTLEISNNTLKNMNAGGCCVVGHPDYYRKFRFENVAELVHKGIPLEVFFILSFDGHIPQETVEFHEGFKVDDQPGVGV